VLTEVENSADNGLNRTHVGVTTARQPNNFSTNSILLVGEGEGSKACLANLLNGSGEKLDAGVTNEKLDVVEVEWGLDILSVYSPGRRRKKKAMMIMSAAAR